MAASIRVRNATIQVPYFVQEETAGKGWLATLLKAASSIPKRQFATLIDNVSFDVEEGDRVALIGRNGAGKTTMLRALTGAFPPSSGSIELSGSRQALLNLNSGFNAEATLLENIFLRATAMGLHASEIRDLAASILDFAELTDIGGRRMSTLSSGQRMRLGFAIATSVRTEILLLDEWLGTGDAHFVRKARQRLTSHVEGSKIVVVASHNTTLTKKLCNKGMLLEKGRLVYFGALDQAMREYKKLYPAQASGKTGAAKTEKAKSADSANPTASGKGKQMAVNADSIAKQDRGAKTSDGKGEPESGGERSAAATAKSGANEGAVR